MKKLLLVFLVLISAGITASAAEIYLTPTKTENLTAAYQYTQDILESSNGAFVIPNSTDTDSDFYVKYSRILNFYIDDTVISGNSSFEKMAIDIEYLDNGYDYFYITYDSHDGEKLCTEYIELYNTGDVVTATVLLDDARFSNLCLNTVETSKETTTNADFSITAPRRSGGAGIQIYSVKVRPLGSYAGVKISSKSNSPGNIFFDGAKQTVDVIFQNMHQRDLELDVKYALIKDDSEISDITKSITLGVAGELTDSIDLSAAKEYSTYTLRVSVTGTDIQITKDIPFSVCADAGIGGGNPWIGIGGHFNWGRDSAAGIEIIKNAGIAHLREGYSWANFETAEGEYYEPESCTEYIANAQEKGISLLVAATYGNKLYGMASTQHMPETDVQREAYVNYIMEMLQRNHDKIEVLEIWNEPDSKSYNPDFYSTQANYILLLKAAAVRVREKYPNIKIAGPVLSSATLETKQAWLEAFLSADSDGDGVYDAKDYFDVLTIHHYAKDNKYSVTKIVSAINRIKDLMEKYDYDKELYHTEFGANHIERVYDSTKKRAIMVKHSLDVQAQRLSAYYLGLHAAKLGERFYIYDFSNDDFAENVKGYNYGIVHSHESDVPYAAKPSLLAVANINRLVGGAEESEYTELELPGCTHGAEEEHRAYMMSFTNSSGQKTYAFFTDCVETAFTLPQTGAHTAFYDMYGNTLNAELQNGEYNFKAGVSPVFAKVYPENTISAQVFREGNTAVIQGTLTGGDAGDRISVRITDQTGQTVYLDETAVNNKQVFEFIFEPDQNAVYTAKLAANGICTEITIDTSLLARAALEISSGAVAVNTVEEFNSAQNLTVSAKIFDRTLTNSKMVIGYYSDGNLIDTKIMPSDSLANSNADTIKVFLLEENGITPATDNLVLE